MVKRLDPPLLEFGDSTRVDDPIRAFAELRSIPYHTPASLFKGIELIPIVPDRGELRNLLLELLRGLVSGVSGVTYSRNKFGGFRDAFRFDVTIRDAMTYSQVSDVREIIDRISRTEDLARVAVAIAIPEKTTGCGNYQLLKVHSIYNRVRSQFFTGEKMMKYRLSSGDEKGEFMWNVALAFFSKMEGMPWKLLQPLGGLRGVIGLNTVMQRSEGKYERTGVTALHVWNDWGECVGGFHTKHQNLFMENGRLSGVASEGVREMLRSALSLMTDIPAWSPDDNNALTVHVSDNYSREAFDMIQESVVSQGYSSWKIIRIEDSSVHFLYDPSQTKNRQKWPIAGTWDYIRQGRRAYLYTRGAWKYYSGPPYARSQYPITPLDVTLIRSNDGNTLAESDMLHIYQLTRLAYYTGDLIQAKIPITVKLGRHGASLVQCGLSGLSIPLSFLY